MAKQLAAAVALLGCAIVARGDDDQAEKLRREVADLRVKLAEKEQELAKLSPPKVVQFVSGFELNVGEAGPWRDTFVQVRRVLDDRRMLVVAGNPSIATVPIPQVILASYPTAGIGEGKLLRLDQVRVVGTTKHEERTLTVIEPYIPAKK